MKLILLSLFLLGACEAPRNVDFVAETVILAKPKDCNEVLDIRIAYGPTYSCLCKTDSGTALFYRRVSVSEWTKLEVK